MRIINTLAGSTRRISSPFIGFTGTQVGMTNRQRQTARHILRALRPSELHHGDCIGSDAQIHTIAENLGNIKIYLHPPINETKRAFCKSHYISPAKDYIPRNHDIVLQSTILLATPETVAERNCSGTWATIRFARKKNRMIIIVEPDGRVRVENPRADIMDALRHDERINITRSH